MGFAAALAGKCDAPAGTVDAGHGQILRRNAGDMPARHRGRGQRQRIFVASPPAFQHQGGGASLFGGELEPAGGGHVETGHFPHHRGEGACTKTFLHDRQYILVTAAFGVEHLTGRETDLRQARSEQVPPSQRPKHRPAASRTPRGYSSRKQGCCRIIVEAGSCAGHFVQGRDCKAVSGEPPVDPGYSERQIFPLPGWPDSLDRPYLGAQGVEPLTTGWRQMGHGDSQTLMFTLCSAIENLSQAACKGCRTRSAISCRAEIRSSSPRIEASFVVRGSD